MAVNKSLPVPLKEFNQLVESIAKFERMRGRTLTHSEADAKARKMVAENGFPGVEGVELREAKKWEEAGLSPDAARIAAQEQLAKMTPEDWIQIGESLTR